MDNTIFPNQQILENDKIKLIPLEHHHSNALFEANHPEIWSFMLIIRNLTKMHTLGLVWEGEGKLQIDNQLYHLGPGSLFQIKPNVKLYLQSEMNENLRFYSIQYIGQVISCTKRN